MIQVLDLWRKQLPLDGSYTVGNLVEDVKVWMEEGYLDVGVLDKLRQYVNPELLPIPVAMVSGVLVHEPRTRRIEQLSISSGRYVFITEGGKIIEFLQRESSLVLGDITLLFHKLPNNY